MQALCERRVLVTLTGYPRGGAPGPGRNFVTRATRNQREIWYMESGPSRVNAPLEGPVIPRSRRSLSKTKASGKEEGGEALSPGLVPEIKSSAPLTVTPKLTVAIVTAEVLSYTALARVRGRTCMVRIPDAAIIDSERGS